MGIGAAELIGGLLLTTRRTTLLGALVLAPVAIRRGALSPLRGRLGSLVLLGNARNVAEVILTGVCHRYPDQIGRAHV